MDKNGFERVGRALNDHNVEARIEPVPTEGKDVPYVTIYSDGRIIAATVLNALDAAGVGENRGLTNRRNGPELVLKSQTETSIRFVDKLAPID
jgi:hypothetical protein